MNKEKQIETLTKDLLRDVQTYMKDQIKKALKSGAIDVEHWDPSANKMIIPKIILIAILETTADQYKATGTSFEKEVKREVKNLKLFI